MYIIYDRCRSYIDEGNVSKEYMTCNYTLHIIQLPQFLFSGMHCDTGMSCFLHKLENYSDENLLNIMFSETSIPLA